MTFQLYWEYSRAFPLQEEVYQNTPSILVIQELIQGQIPIVIQIRTTGRIEHFVYMAFRFERVAGMLNWAEHQTRIDRPYEAFLDRRRVFGHQDVPLRPGSVLQLRLHSSMEMLFPHDSTTWTNSIQTGDTDDTWEALPLAEDMDMPLPDGEQNEDEHTLEPRRTLQNLHGENEQVGLLQKGIWKQQRKPPCSRSDNTATLPGGHRVTIIEDAHIDEYPTGPGTLDHHQGCDAGRCLQHVPLQLHHGRMVELTLHVDSLHYHGRLQDPLSTASEFGRSEKERNANMGLEACLNSTN